MIIVFGNRENLKNKYTNPNEFNSNMNNSDADEHRNLKGTHVGEIREAAIPIAGAVLYGTTFCIHSFDGKLLAEYDAAGNCQKDYIYMGGKLLAEYQPAISKYYYYTSDQINSTRIVTDSTGAIVSSSLYDPYGGVQKVWVNTYNPKLGFSGKERESSSELDYFGARYYGHKQYRFLSVDPVINKDEALGNPQLWNLYAYCHNNPVTFFDPDGREVWVYARRVSGSLGVGVHTFIFLKPDNPKDFNGETQWTLSAYGKNIEGEKRLVTEKNWKDDVEWGNKNSFKAKYRIEPPVSQTDSEFINRIMSAFNSYPSGSRKYKLLPNVKKNAGNCNTVTAGALVGAGVSLDEIKELDPAGANPGLSTPLPEMKKKNQ